MQIGFATHMQRHPWYEWGNTWSGGEGSSGCSSPPCDVNFGENVSQLEKGRDYFDDVPQGGSLPGGCAAYAGFFHTAERTLYRCDASGQWQAYYKEFPYPHPLQGNSSGGASGSGGAGGGGAGGIASGGTSNGGGAGSGAGGSGGASNGGGDGDSGCGCEVPRSTRSPSWVELLGLAAMAARSRRARRFASRSSSKPHA